MTDPFWSDTERTIYYSDCLPVLREMEAESVSLIIADPPYYKVKADWWDRQWETVEGYLEWLDGLLAAFHRVLAPNGSLYLFAAPKMAARVECKVAERFEVLNGIVWPKADETSHALKYGDDRFRQYVQKSERIIFAEHIGSDGYARGEAGWQRKCDELRGFVFEPLRAYLDEERKRAGLRIIEVRDGLGFRGNMPWHWFATGLATGRVSQWQLPTEKHYEALRALVNCQGTDGQYLCREYEDLRREYEDLRAEYEDARRPFTVSADVPYTDVWDFPTVQHYKGKHPCEKPLAMMEHIVRASSREGDLVLDPFCGSGVAGEAARKLGRQFVGIDADEKWCEVSRRRVEAIEAPGEEAQLSMLA